MRRIKPEYNANNYVWGGGGVDLFLLTPTNQTNHLKKKDI